MACCSPARGEVLVDGTPTTAWDPVRLKRRIGYVIQEIGLFPHYTVARKRRPGAAPGKMGWRRAFATVWMRCCGRWASIPEQFAARYPRAAFRRPAAARGRSAGVGGRSVRAAVSTSRLARSIRSRASICRSNFWHLRRESGQDRYLRHPRCARSAAAGHAHRPAARWRTRIGGVPPHSSWQPPALRRAPFWRVWIGKRTHHESQAGERDRRNSRSSI